MGGKYLTEKDRYTLERLLKKKQPINEIAQLLDKSVRTIYREIKRGTITLINSELEEYQCYCADFAQNDTIEKQKNKGPKPLILNDEELCNLLVEGIVKEYRSPDDVIGRLKVDNPDQTIPCTKTVYNCIDKGILPGVTNKNLAVKCNAKVAREQTIKRKYPEVTFRSIDERPLDILKRLEFGNWEMDCVESTKDDSTTLVVLTERLSRHTLYSVMPEHTQKCVVQFLDKLEQRYRHKFKQIFKTITMDRGHEFINPDSIEKSIFTKKSRTITYYCHPAMPSERGSNENWNKQLRRFIKKGVKISDLSLHFIDEAVARVNNMHRKILNYKSSQEVFDYYVSLI